MLALHICRPIMTSAPSVAALGVSLCGDCLGRAMRECACREPRFDVGAPIEKLAWTDADERGPTSGGPPSKGGSIIDVQQPAKLCIGQKFVRNGRRVIRFRHKMSPELTARRGPTEAI